MVRAGEAPPGGSALPNFGFEYLDRNEAAPSSTPLQHTTIGVSLLTNGAMLAHVWRITAEGVTITTADAPESTSSETRRCLHVGINLTANEIARIFVTFVYAVTHFLFARPQHHIVATKPQNMRKRRAPRTSADN